MLVSGFDIYALNGNYGMCGQSPDYLDIDGFMRPRVQLTADGSGASAVSSLRVLRVIRVLRLVKLVRLVRSSRIMKRCGAALNPCAELCVLLRVHISRADATPARPKSHSNTP